MQSPYFDNKEPRAQKEMGSNREIKKTQIQSNPIRFNKD